MAQIGCDELGGNILFQPLNHRLARGDSARQGFTMAQVSDHHLFFRGDSSFPDVSLNRSLEIFKAHFLPRRDTSSGGNGSISRESEIDFVPDEKGFFSWDGGDELPIVLRKGEARIEKEENEVGFLHGFLGAADPLLFNLLLCLADPRRVDEAEVQGAEPQLLLEEIAGRSRNIGDNGPLFSQKGVHQR